MSTVKKYFPHILLGIYAVWCLILGRNPVDRSIWWAENLPVFIPVFFLIITFKKFRFSNWSYFLMFVFFCFHIIGGHYTFEKVPFDAGNEFLSSLHCDFFFPEGRNNFDRIAHFLIGVFAYPIAELFLRKGWVKGVFTALFVGICVLGFWGALYEIIEMIFAVIVGGEEGVLFLGSQGDIRDAQKDMLLDTMGAVTISCLFYYHFREYSIEE